MTARLRQKGVAYILIGFIAGGVFGAALGYLAGGDRRENQAINSYEECVSAGYPVMESYPARCSVPGGKSFTQDTSATFEGRIVCLPHKNTDGPQTLECATGLLTDDGKHYTLRSESPDNSLASEAGSDKRVRVTGTLRQKANDIYQSEGTIEIKSYDFL